MYGIFAYMYHNFKPNVGKIPYMEHTYIYIYVYTRNLFVLYFLGFKPPKGQAQTPIKTRGPIWAPGIYI